MSVTSKNKILLEHTQKSITKNTNHQENLCICDFLPPKTQIHIFVCSLSLVCTLAFMYKVRALLQPYSKSFACATTYYNNHGRSRGIEPDSKRTQQLTNQLLSYGK